MTLPAGPMSKSDMLPSLHQAEELIHRDPRVADEGAKQPRLQLPVVGNRERGPEPVWMPQAHVAPTLADDLVPEPLEDLDSLPAGDAR